MPDIHPHTDAEPDTAHPTLLDAAAALRAGDTSATELTERALRRIARLDPRLHAVATPTPQLARAHAAQADDELRRGHDRGPLHGIPVGLKDLIAVDGVPLGAGMPLRGGAVSDHDATVVRRLREAGAVVVGTLQMTEGAYFEHHPDVAAPRNPWDPDLWPGASSSGPAVAVAAGLVYAALGSDTGGSIRFPAAANRVVGLKPTRGRVSTHGTFHAAQSLDHIGVFTRSACDAAAVLHAVAGHDPDDPDSLADPVPDYPAETDTIDLAGLRIGVDHADNAHADAAARAAIDRAAAELTARGAVVVPVELPDTGDARAAWAVICSVEAADNHRDTYPAHAGAYGPLAGFLDSGRATTALALAHARRVRAGFTTRLTAVVDTVDALLTPTQPRSRITNADKDAMIADPDTLAEFVRYATPLNMSGHPTLTVPAAGNPGWTSLQLIAPHLHESRLFALGRALHATAPGHWPGSSHGRTPTNSSSGDNPGPSRPSRGGAASSG